MRRIRSWSAAALACTAVFAGGVPAIAAERAAGRAGESPVPTVSASAAVQAATTAQDADPALWVLKDEDTTIYLFGTIHVLQPGLSWFDEAVATAFDAADELRTEVLLPDDPAALAPIMLKYALDPGGRPLSAKFTPAQLERYRAGLARFGLPGEQFEAFQPWFVELQVSLATLVALGMDPEHGVEQALFDAAKAKGKRMTAFETVEEQMQYLASTPEQEQIASLLDTLADAERGKEELRDLVDGWAHGDPERTGARMNESLRDAPETVRVLLTDRNRRWAKALEQRMAQPGVVFVAVGAGHLAGRDSVQDFLAKDGLKVERVRY